MASSPNEKCFIDLDEQLKQLAINDWQAFVELVGKDHIIRAKVCLLAKRGKSIGQISITLNASREAVRWAKLKTCRC